MKYDSSIDTKAHIATVKKLMSEVIVKELLHRASIHDASKLSSPEKEMYDKYIPLLRNAKYGSKEYLDIRDKMAKGALSHHFDKNPHHPEHFNNDFTLMSLIDIMEMFVDWVAASSRSDTSFMDGLSGNQERLKYPDILQNLFENTYVQYFDGKEKNI